MNAKFQRCCSTCFLFATADVCAQGLPPKKKILKPLRVANEYFMKKWPDPGKSIVTNRNGPQASWTRGVYYERLNGRKKKYYNYATAGAKNTMGPHYSRYFYPLIGPAL